MRPPITPTAITSQTPPQPDSVIPFSNRLVDHFFIVSCQNLLDTLWTTEQHPDDIRHPPTVTIRYPAPTSEVKDTFPMHLPMFCFPDGGVALLYHRDSAPPSAFHSFIITDDAGLKSYAACLTVYELLSHDEMNMVQAQIKDHRKSTIPESEQEYIAHIQDKLFEAVKIRQERLSLGRYVDILTQEHILLYQTQLLPYERVLRNSADYYKPKCIGVLSRWPFYGQYRDWLVKLTDNVGKRNDWLSIPFERLVVHFVNEIPLPPPGKLQVSAKVNTSEIRFSRPPLNTVNVIRSFSLCPLFSILSIEDCVTIYEYVIAERKILLVSKTLALLNIIAESIVTLLFPLFWQHVYIPVLPLQLITYIHAPVPYIIGILAAHKNVESFPDDVLVVDLDAGSIKIPLAALQSPNQQITSESPTRGSALPMDFVPQIPSHERSKLKLRLSKAVRLNKYQTKNHVSRMIATPESQHDFLWASIASGRNEHLTFVMTQIRDEIYMEREVNRNVPLIQKNDDVMNSSMSEMTLAPSIFTNGIARDSQVTIIPTKSVTPDIESLNGSARSNSTTMSVYKDLPVPPPHVLRNLDMGVYAVDEESEETVPPSYQLKIGEDRQSFQGSTNSFVSTHSHSTSTVSTTETAKSQLYFGGTDSKPLPVPPERVTSLQVHTDVQRSNQVGIKHSDTKQTLFTPVPFLKSASSNVSPSSLMNQISGFMETSKIRIQTSLTSIDASKMSSSSTLNSLGETSSGFIYPSSTLDIATVTSPGGTEFQEQYYYPFVYRPSSQMAPSTNNFHSSFIAPEEYKFAMKSEEFPPEIQLMVCPTFDDTAKHRSNARIFGEEGHVFWRLSTVSTVVVSNPKPIDPDATLPVGVCAVCNEQVRAPYLRANQAVWTVNGTSYVKKLPTSCEPKFSKALGCEGCCMTVHEACASRIVSYCPRAFNEVKVQDAFFKLWTSLLRNYRSYLVSPEKQLEVVHFDRSMSNASTSSINFGGQWSALSKLARKGVGASSSMSITTPDVNDLDQKDLCPAFKKNNFLRLFSDNETRLFMYCVCDTQAFAQFAHDRAESVGVDYEILFFDEAIKAKVNRSKMRLTKEVTPFLEDKAYSINSTVHAMPINLTGLEDLKLIPRYCIPDEFDDMLVLSPRRFKPLVTEKDSTRLKIYTNAILRRARINKIKKKPEFSDWLKQKVLGPTPQPTLADLSKSGSSMKLSIDSQWSAVNMRIDNVYKSMEVVLHEYDQLGLENLKSVRATLMMTTRGTRVFDSGRHAQTMSSLVGLDFSKKLEIETMLRKHLRQFETLCTELKECLRDIKRMEVSERTTEEDDVVVLLDQLESFVLSHTAQVEAITNVKDEEDFTTWAKKQVDLKQAELGL